MELRAAVVVLLSCCVWWFSSLLLLVLNRPSLSLVYRYILCLLKLPLFFLVATADANQHEEEEDD